MDIAFTFIVLCESSGIYRQTVKLTEYQRDGMTGGRMPEHNTVKILCIGTDRFHQTVQTKIRLLLKKQSDQGLRCLPFNQHLLDALMQCYS